MAKKEQADTSKQEFAIQRIYTTDVSFESPTSPALLGQEWKPEMNLDLHTKSNVVEGEEDLHEVILSVTVTVKSGDKTAFLVEIKQAGIFQVKGFSDSQLQHTLGSFCPSVLYPYAREAVTDLVTRGGFPQLILAPVNFDALYAQHQKQAAEGGAAG